MSSFCPFDIYSDDLNESPEYKPSPAPKEETLPTIPAAHFNLLKAFSQITIRAELRIISSLNPLSCQWFNGIMELLDKTSPVEWVESTYDFEKEYFRQVRQQVVQMNILRLVSHDLDRIVTALPADNEALISTLKKIQEKFQSDLKNLEHANRVFSKTVEFLDFPVLQ